MRKILTAISLLFIVSCSSTNSINPQLASEQQSDKQELICKRTQITGSNFKKKVCWTKEEYAAVLRNSQEQLQRMRDKESTNIRNGSSGRLTK